MIANEKLSIALVEGEMAVVFRRTEDFDEALEAAEDMGLPLATTQSVGDAFGFYPGLFGPGSAEADDMKDFHDWIDDE